MTTTTEIITFPRKGQINPDAIRRTSIDELAVELKAYDKALDAYIKDQQTGYHTVSEKTIVNDLVYRDDQTDELIAAASEAIRKSEEFDARFEDAHDEEGYLIRSGYQPSFEEEQKMYDLREAARLRQLALTSHLRRLVSERNAAQDVLDAIVAPTA